MTPISHRLSSVHPSEVSEVIVSIAEVSLYGKTITVVGYFVEKRRLSLVYMEKRLLESQCRDVVKFLLNYAFSCKM